MCLADYREEGSSDWLLIQVADTCCYEVMCLQYLGLALYELGVRVMLSARTPHCREQKYSRGRGRGQGQRAGAGGGGMGKGGYQVEAGAGAGAGAVWDTDL